MNLLSFSGLINFLACLSLAYVVWKNRPKDPVARAYAIFNCTVGFFSFFYFAWQLSTSKIEGEILFKILVLGIIWINQAYVNFIFTFLPESPKNKQRNILLICAALNLGFSFLDVSGKLFSTVEPRFNLGFWPIPTVWFSIYLVFWHIECVYGFVELIKGFWRKDLTEKQSRQLKYFVVAFAIGYFGGANNWPMWYGVHFPPYLNNLIAVYIGIIAYAILYHQLMDVRLVLRDTTLHLTTAGLMGIGCMMIGLPLAKVNPFLGVVISILSMGLLMAFAYEPIRRALQPAIDRLMFANQFNYLEELANLPNDILEFTNLREMLKFLVTRLVEAGRLDHATVLMYDPGFQAYITTIHHSADTSKETQRLQWNIPRGNPLIELLRSTKRLLSKEEIQASKLPDISVALESLTELDAAACFGVNTDGQLSALVSLGPKQNREPFNQRDMKILEALKLRVENFLAQAMVTTQESLNMVRDSHDMKNDINSLRGRLPWKGYKIETARENLLNQITLIQSQISAIPNLSEEEKNHLLESLKDVSNEVTRSSQEQYSFLPIEADSLDRLKIKIQNWSEYGRLVAGGFKGDRKFEPVDIRSIAERCVQRWKASAERKNIALVVESEDNLSAFGERSLIEQIIENLIDNGLKATEKGSVRVACKRINDKILIEISDTGCGMSPEDLADILKKPFYQGQGREALERSTGIGLVLVHTYAKSMGGEVQAASTVGQGTSFKVFLPITRSAVTAADKTIAA
jgi:signal transduction histidine kinase